MANENMNLIDTRIALKIDTLTNWNASTFIPLRGEVCLVEIETNVEGSHLKPIMFKVGNGTNKFSELDWASAKAADVYGWAKKAALAPEDLPNIPLEKLPVSDIDTDLDTRYTITLDSNETNGDRIKIVEQLYSKGVASGEATTSYIDVVTPDELTTALNAALASYYTKTEINNLVDGKLHTEAEIKSMAATEINRLIKAADDEGGTVIESIGNLVDYVEKNGGQITKLLEDVNTANQNASNAVQTANNASSVANTANQTASEAKQLATEAKTTAETAQNSAVASASAAAESASAADLAKQGAEAAKGAAEAAKTGAETAQGAAEAAQALSEGARDDAIIAKNAAVNAQTAAETAKGEAISAKEAAVVAQGVAETKAGEAAGSATSALEQAGIATNKASEAAGSASEANSAKEAALAAQSAAETAQTKAEKAQAAAEASNTSATAIANEAKGLAEQAKEASDAATEAVNGLHTIATSGSVYDVAEGSNVSVGTDAGTKYLVFNCGTATTII